MKGHSDFSKGFSCQFGSSNRSSNPISYAPFYWRDTMSRPNIGQDLLSSARNILPNFGRICFKLQGSTVITLMNWPMLFLLRKMHQQFVIFDSGFPVVPGGFEVSGNLEPRNRETWKKLHRTHIKSSMSLLQVVIPVYNPQAVSGFLKFLRFFGLVIALSFHENRHKSPGF